jgi:DNA adenine methylase
MSSEQSTQEVARSRKNGRDRRLSAFPYPGGKTQYVSKILKLFPDHRRYIEAFGGSGAVLLNKPESYIEVFNDLNDDLVHFFRTVREQREELQQWLREVPYSEKQYERWQREFNAGYRPMDDVARAGRWLYLRYTNYGGSPDRRAGFKRPGKKNEAQTFRNGVKALDQVVDRLQEVTLANEDYLTVLERYDSEETLFYLDPPYINVGERYYPSGVGFDHAEFADALQEIEGHWVLSYGEIPESVQGIATTVRDFTAQYPMASGNTKERQEATEHLLLNFDPESVPTFVDRSTAQETLPGGVSVAE